MWALESEILKQRSEHLRFREPHCHLAPLPRVPVRIFAQTLHFQKLESLTYILPLAIWVQISLVGSEKRLSTRVRFGRSRSSKVIDFVTNQKRICDFLLVRHSNLGPILHRFRDIALFSAHDPTPIFHLNFGVFPLDQVAHVGVNVSYSAIKLFSKYSNVCDPGTWTSRTDDILWDKRVLRSTAW